MKYEAVIALEVHVEPATRSKMFCGCPTTFGAAPNSQVCPVCLGHPGVLPAVNQRVVELGIRAALALNGTVHPESVFARKNYFYPDLPKGYQITQYDRPLATGGYVDLHVAGETRRVRVRRVHLEEDTGKSFHGEIGPVGADADAGRPPTDTTARDWSFVDYNRAGVPLLEIVSEPDCRTPAEARAYLEELRSILDYAGVSDVRMEEGSMRCEPNISLRPAGTDALGVPVELKNLNSFRAVERSLHYEIQRQTAVLEAGGRVDRETRGWDEAGGRTVLRRVKETADDYRYFPEPDLPPLILEEEWVEAIRRGLPELAAARRERFVAEHGLPVYDAGVITASRPLADYFEEAAGLTGDPKTAANWVMGDLSALMNETGTSPADLMARDSRFPPAALAEIMALVSRGEISGKMAKDVLEEAFRTGKAPASLVVERGLAQISDAAQIQAVVARVVAANPSVVAEFRAGRDKALGFLVGQVMRETGGRANPGMVNELLRRAAGRE